MAMRNLKLAGALIVALTSLMILATSALATEILPPCLPCENGTTFTESSGKATIQIKGGGSFTCAKGTGEGEVQSELTLLLRIVRWSTCTVGGLPVNSLGDASGTALSHIERHICLLPNGFPGLLEKLLPLHLEVPSTKLLLTVEGSFVDEVTPAKTKSKTFNLIVAQKEGKQAIENCQGGPKGGYTLTTSLDGGAFVQSAIEVKEGSMSFTGEEEFMA